MKNGASWRIVPRRLQMACDSPSTSITSSAPWKRLALYFAVMLGLFCTVTAAVPEIDLTVSRWFFDASTGSWPVAESPFWQVVRQALWRLADLVFAAAVATLTLRVLVARWRIHGCAVPGFLALSYLLGPGLLVNVLLKEHWGRARPFQVAEFGGDQFFTSALTITNQCTHNCSFVGGEASSFAALFFLLFFMLREQMPARYGRIVLAAALFVAVFGSLLRVAFGHHFLSDIVFAWAAMFAVTAAIATFFDRLQWDYRWRRP